MANSDSLGFKFTNIIYATKNDVAEQMKTNMIDSIWDKVLAYRGNFDVTLALKHITGAAYHVCLAPSIADRVNSLERKIFKSLVRYTRLSKSAQKKFKNKCYIEELKSIALKYKIPADESILESIVDESASLLSPEYLILSRYFNCLKYIENSNYDVPINDGFFASVYGIILGNYDLDELFRTTDIVNSYNKVLVNKAYLGVPHGSIPNSMQSLYLFAKTSKIATFVIAVSTFYFLYYVKPFESFSEEISVLLFKQILSNGDFKEISTLLNVETLLLHQETLEKYVIESQRTLDMTYILNYVLKKFENYIEDFNDSLTLIEKENIVDETYSLDVEIAPKENISTEKNTIDNKASANENNNKTADNTISYNREIAFKNMPEGLEDEEAIKFEKHLQELYPSLSRGQAYFYARHCTIGMKYTIAQYKRELGCAYETARTSMDALVFLGFYKKEPLKNKFIYTPVKKN